MYNEGSVIYLTLPILPTNESDLKMVFLALQSRTKKWTMRVHGWNMIIGQLSIRFGERVEVCL